MKNLTAQFCQQMDSRFAADSANRTMQNAVTQTGVEEVALNRRVVAGTDHTFSHQLDEWAVTHQKATGRCWLFSGLNLLRVGAMKKMDVKEFEFSQNYIFYWHKLERANFFLEAIIETGDRETDDRTVAYLLDHPADDAGQWTMFADVVRKHGLVPKALMPETNSSSNSRTMNRHLATRLRHGAAALRSALAAAQPLSEVHGIKERVLADVHRMLRFHLGDPPTRFIWQWNDKDRGFHRDDEMSPIEFADRYTQEDLEDYVCLVNDPRSTSGYGLTYTIQYMGNVVGGDPVVYLNVPMEEMKKTAMRTIVEGRPVWFGCDMAHMTGRTHGLMDTQLYELDRLYGCNMNLQKDQRLEYHQSRMGHAMLFTGIDIMDETPRRWRVENSWGEDAGSKGFFVMSDEWFTEYVFEVAVRREYLSAELQAALEIEPIVLPPWDPMGSLARS